MKPQIKYRLYSEKEINFISGYVKKKIKPEKFVRLFCKKFDRTLMGITGFLYRLEKKHPEIVLFRKASQKMRERAYYQTAKGKERILASNKKWNENNFEQDKKARQNRRVLNPGQHEKRCKNYRIFNLKKIEKYEMEKMQNKQWDDAIISEKQRQKDEKKFKKFYLKLEDEIKKKGFIYYTDILKLIQLGLKAYIKQWGEKYIRTKLIKPPVSKQMMFKYNHYNRFNTFMPKQTLEVMLKETHISTRIMEHIQNYNPDVKHQKPNKRPRIKIKDIKEIDEYQIQILTSRRK